MRDKEVKLFLHNTTLWWR